MDQQNKNSRIFQQRPQRRQLRPHDGFSAGNDPKQKGAILLNPKQNRFSNFRGPRRRTNFNSSIIQRLNSIGRSNNTFAGKQSDGRPKRPWLPRAQWLHKKRFWHAIALIKRDRWEQRQSQWRKRNKRPFWKRKSFKRLRAEQNILGNLFFTSKKLYAGSIVYQKKHEAKKILFRRYFRHNVVKREFKTRIILRHYWKHRYSYYTHDKLKNFLQSVKKKARRLFKFFCKFEIVLYRYCQWWGLIPHFCPDHLAQSFISHGYVYVNFIVEPDPWYEVKVVDCIFSSAPLQLITNWLFYSKYETLYGHSKFNPGRREFSRVWKDITLPLNVTFFKGSRYRKKLARERWMQERFENADSLYLKLRSLLSVSVWSMRNLIHYSVMVETSYKVRVLVPILGNEWFTLAFGCGRVPNDVSTILANKFLNSSYF